MEWTSANALRRLWHLIDQSDFVRFLFIIHLLSGVLVYINTYTYVYINIYIHTYLFVHNVYFRIYWLIFALMVGVTLSIVAQLKIVH